MLVFKENAISKIKEILKDSTNYFKIDVVGGGCSGFKYEFTTQSQKYDTDTEVMERVLVDAEILELISGSEVDYIEENFTSRFLIKNPNAKSMCGCSKSFGV